MGGGSSHSPLGNVDRSVLVAIEQRLRSAPYIRATHVSVRREKPTLKAHLDRAYLPRDVEDVYYDVRWYTSGDFELHYQENWRGDREWKRRWDRHPRDGQRTHYHPPPDAANPPEPVRLPSGYYDVLGVVERETLDHIQHHPLYEG